MEPQICPLIFSGSFAEEEPVDTMCRGADCAWYIPELEACAVKQVARSLAAGHGEGREYG